MANVREAAQKLIEMLVRTHAEVSMVERHKQRISGLIDQARSIEATLVDIDQNVVPLELAPASQDGGLKVGASFWDTVEPGRLTEASPLLGDLMDASPTLNALYQAGLTFKSMYKFSKEEEQFAHQLGENFDSWAETLADARIAHANSHPGFRVHPKRTRLTAAFLRQMVGSGCVSSWQFFQHLASGEWTEIGEQDAHRASQKVRVKVDWNSERPDLIKLLLGNWFSAYTAEIIQDHLTRVKRSHELFTLVEYAGPADIVRTAGDVDVLARVGGKVLLAECKSGNLREMDCKKIVWRRNDLQKVFASMGINDYAFWLVFNPYQTTEPGALEIVEGAGIEIVPPSKVRERTRALFPK